MTFLMLEKINFKLFVCLFKREVYGVTYLDTMWA